MHGLEKIPAPAKDVGLKVVPTAWLSKDEMQMQRNSLTFWKLQKVKIFLLFALEVGFTIKGGGMIEGSLIIAGAGIICMGGADPTIQNNTITNNAGGISCWHNSSPTITE
jgi:parallel beta-helix repeat protein